MMTSRRLPETYHAWRGEPKAGKYEDIPGFCKSAKLEEIRKSPPRAYTWPVRRRR